MVQPLPAAGKRAEDAHYFKSVADYIHLNPARAGLAGGGRDRLVDYPWSSLRHYPKGNAPDWQPMDRKRGQSLDIYIFIDSDS